MAPSPWQIAIIVLVLILLFGAKKLPDAARSIGRSMKIFKAETKGLHEDDDSGGSDSSSSASSRTSQAAQDGTEPVDPDMRQLPRASATRADQDTGPSKDEQVAELQRQLDEMKKQTDGSQRNAS
ncbi:Sec-independent protein translocase subunit TatA [Haloechinothrix sp. LS1_15]|uniref:Sec-independent protein translocase subunit TatA n=1 Tax=Haloechinothrix sp. LS1_15 TaxID=2652248 RepID=UPI0029471CB5|nr:Sec-independent protein translocase subunit TatA [Haloechinothrix sp. LS1_15]MDV6013996.1 Sec-independent protein translocase subunit TatA [Haloechinothrix sp. LS1_15]